jgi:trigger factor
LIVNVTVETLAPCKKLVRIEVEPQAVDSAFEEMAKNFQRQVTIPGFRAGKAPKAMVLKRHETEIQEEVKKKLIPDSYRQAVKEQKLNVVGYPDIEEIQFGKGQALQFAATIETAPDFELPEYKGITVKRESATVTDADVEKALVNLRERVAKYETVQRPAGDQDVAVVNYKGTTDGKPLTDIAPSAKGITEKQNTWIAIDPNAFIPGFGTQLAGASAGDKREVNIEFPLDFVQPALAGKKAVYEVEIIEIKQRILPELNDEFAKQYEAESLDKLKEGVRNDLQNELNLRQKRSIREQLIKALIDKVPSELPEGLVSRETRQIVYNIVNENQRRGIPQEAIEGQKNEIFASANTAARDRVKTNFVFARIAEREGLRVEQVELLQRIQAMAAQYQMPPEKLAKDLQTNDRLGEVADQVLHEKVLDLLAQNAKYEDVAA